MRWVRVVIRRDVTPAICIVPQDLLEWLKSIRHEIDTESKEYALQAAKSFDLATGEIFDVVCGPHETPSGIVWAVVKAEDRRREVVVLYEPTKPLEKNSLAKSSWSRWVDA